MSRIASTFGKQSKVPRTSTKELGGYETGVSTSQTMKSTTSLKNDKLSTSNIESEYIKNLQQQVYFLELEANYLREQAKKATDMHPRMTAEAERMLQKLRTMQTEMDGMNLEITRKQGSIEEAHIQRNKVIDKLNEAESTFAREKRLLTDELVSVRQEKEALQRELLRKQTTCEQYAVELEKNAVAAKAQQQKMDLLRSQMEQRDQTHKQTQLALDEKRAEQLSTQAQLRELEDKYYSSPVTLQDSQLTDLREELRYLRQKLKETEMAAEQDRMLRSKMSDDSSHLIKENALLNQQVLEAQKQLDRERSLRESWDVKRAQNVTQLVTSQTREKELEFELRRTREELKHEQQRVHAFLKQVSDKELTADGLASDATHLRARVVSLEQSQTASDADNAALRNEKLLLADHASQLQAKLTQREEEVLRLRSEVRSLEAQVSEMGHLKRLHSTMNSSKWQEFEQLAQSMQSLSRSMMSANEA